MPLSDFNHPHPYWSRVVFFSLHAKYFSCFQVLSSLLFTHCLISMGKDSVGLPKYFGLASGARMSLAREYSANPLGIGSNAVAGELFRNNRMGA